MRLVRERSKWDRLQTAREVHDDGDAVPADVRPSKRSWGGPGWSQGLDEGPRLRPPTEQAPPRTRRGGLGGHRRARRARRRLRGREDYPHGQLLALLEAAEPHIGHTGREAQRWFGRRALLQLTDEFYPLFRHHDSTAEFAAAINEEIHPAVEKRYPGAELPVLLVDEQPREGDLRLRYDSERGLCSFAEGILEGVGNLYGEKVAVEQPCCVHEGHPYCDLVLTVEGAAGEDPFYGLDELDPPRGAPTG